MPNRDKYLKDMENYRAKLTAALERYKELKDAAMKAIAGFKNVHLENATDKKIEEILADVDGLKGNLEGIKSLIGPKGDITLYEDSINHIENELMRMKSATSAPQALRVISSMLKRL